MIADILELIAVSLVAGIGISASYSFVVLGVGRSAQARRAGSSVASVAYGALSVFSLLVFAGGILLAVKIMLTKA
jgi:hypothetical protein